MTQSLARAEPIGLALHVFGEDRIAVLKEQLSRGWKEPMTDAELEHIALIYQRTHLDPLAKPAQIYFIKRWDARLRKEVMTPQVSIDGLRLIAQRSRKRFQQVGPEWTADGKTWLDVWLDEKPPAAARVGIRQLGFPEPTWSVATWRECAQTQTIYDAQGNATNRTKLAPFWEKMGAHMLAKTAEGLALKRQFSLETNELELARIDEDWRQEQTQQARRYTEIYGADEDHSPYELPSGRVVDTVTGEVLSEPSSAQELTDPEPSGAAAGPQRPPSSPQTREGDAQLSPSNASSPPRSSVTSASHAGFVAHTNERGETIHMPRTDDAARAAAIVEQAHAAAQARDDSVAQLSRAQLRERWASLTGKARDLGVEYEPISQSVSDADALAAVEDLERRVRDAETGLVKESVI